MHAAAAAKYHQSCLTLDPTDGGAQQAPHPDISPYRRQFGVGCHLLHVMYISIINIQSDY